MNSIFELFDLHDKIVIVTGARNLGYDAAETLAELGATVIITTRSIEKSKKIAAEIKSKIEGSKIIGEELEITDENSWKDLIKKIVKNFGALDVLVNNAGGRNPQANPNLQNVKRDLSYDFIEGRPIEEWTHTINTNLTGTFLGCRAVVPIMKKKGSGKIINIASIDGIVARDLNLYKGTDLSPTVPDYLVSKAAIIHLTKALAVALATFNINVNCVSPGGFYRGQPDKFVRRYCKMVPLGRMARDGIDLKGAIAYLASSASDYVTGHNLVIDGGWTIW